ncbi:MAG TPA: NYN domain-containing protein [Thermoanaerobaculia bacterium]
MEEENREQPKSDVQETENPAEAAPPIPVEPPGEGPADAVVQPEWHVEPAPPPSAPVFAESASVLPTPMPLPAEEIPFDDEPFDEEDGAEEPEEMEASQADPEEKEGESKTEARRRRSRGRRGGKKRNGKTAAAATPAEEEEDEEEPVHEEPAPAAPRRLAPVAAPQYRVARGGDSYVIPPAEAEQMSREIVISIPDRQRSASDERKIALFCDFENIALGVRDSDIGKFEISLVLERLLEKGKIIVKKAYADWERYSDYKRPFHEAAIELIDIPQKFYSGKNSADIKMVVDAMDLSYAKEHLDTFVILSGDSDFSPLVSKLKENNKYVIGIGVKNSSSNLLVDNCDEFIYYEDVWRDAQKGPKLDGLNKKTAEAFSLMIESIQALIRENKDVLWGSMIKQTMQRKKPSFNEGYYGYSTFSELLEDAERKNIIKLKKDQRSGTYIVTGFAKTGDGATAAGRR